MKNLIFIISLILLFTNLSLSQDESKLSPYQPRYLVDMNTAGLLERGSFAVCTEQMSAGVLILKIDVGLFKEFNFGISYGASNFLGRGSMNFYSYPGVNVRFRIFPEEIGFPAILLGFDSQGKGEYNKDTLYENRYEIKSPGFFIVASKNVKFFGNLGLHGGLNYSLETKDQNKKLNFSLGVDKALGQNFTVIAEYNFSLNDDVNSYGRGFLNAGIRWIVAEGFTLGLDLRNILSNKSDINYIDRGFRIEFSRNIF